MRFSSRNRRVDPTIERDDEDDRCPHFLALVDGEPVGASRLVRKGDSAKLGRLAVLKPYRRQGVGKALVRCMESWAMEKGIVHLTLHSQAQARIFWASVGYREQGAPFMEADIPHVEMVKDLESAGRNVFGGVSR